MISSHQIVNKSLSRVISNKNSFQIFYVIVGVISICFLGFIFTKDIELWIDIGIGDEAKYLGDGANFFRTKPDPS